MSGAYSPTASGAFDSVVELLQGWEHQQVECPQDDTCTCDNIARLNKELAVLELAARSHDRLVNLLGELVQPAALAAKHVEKARALLDEINTSTQPF